ncbi:hypothetical protein [Hoeflea sp.]|uniref:hypothetical protein n=1 Tax=Hoeflea sp. TaxID=1940281 RepID=UPI003748E227
MAMAEKKYFSAAEVKLVCDPILEQMLEPYGFTSSKIDEVEDFDGSYIFRVTANVVRKIPSKLLIDVTQQIHASLRALGEDRFVNLAVASQANEADEIEEDVG